MTVRPIKHKDWLAEACRLFGNDMANWVFVCPVCEHEASCGDFTKVGGKHSYAPQECIGRHLPKDKRRSALTESGPGPCTYAGYGLFQLAPVTVLFPDGETRKAFEFGKPK